MKDRRVYLISDTHFGDGEKGIISFERRPFKNANDMIDKLIDNWNQLVKENDTIWHLGDVFWGLEDDKRKQIVESLNGHKFLVMGNHDKDKSTQYWRDLGFEEVYDRPVILNDFFILSHEPMYMTSGPYVNVFGHVHGNRAYKDFSETSFCVCVERESVGYKPIEIEKIRKYIASILV